MRHLTAALSAILLCAPAIPAAGPFPAVAAENLSGQKVEFPGLAKGRTVAVVIGFTHASQNQTKEWSKRIGHDLEAYSVAVLEDVPRLVRGMATSGIKSSVPKEARDHFLLVFKGEKELKQAAGFDRPDDAYVLLLNRSGEVRWQFHGPVTDAALADLKSKAAAE